jgi:arylsulfatase A-like enzyme
MNKPNIVIITTHDTGSHFGCYGHPTVTSPNIDQLATEGVRFTRCFATSAICSPSRAAMMTGRYPQSNGVLGLVHAPWNWHYRKGEAHLSHLLRERGYETHLFMFQHESEEVSELGFDHCHCLPEPPAPGQLPPASSHPPADQVAARFADFCETRSKQDAPFYAQIGFFETHHPLDYNGNTGDDSRGVEVPEYYAPNAYRKDFKLIQGLIRRADEAIGTITDALKRNQLLDETLLIFTVDHGLPFARAKTTTYEAGLEVALIVRWPTGGVPSGQIDDRLVSNIDLLPTLFDLTSMSRPEGLEGVSFAPALGGTSADAARTEVFGLMQQEMNESRSIRTDRYKLIRNFAPGRLVELPVGSQPATREIPCCQLFDLDQDPHESRNLATDPAFADIRRELDKRLLTHLQSVNDPILQGPVKTPYYRQAAADFLAGASACLP